jgi:GAF domain-containing protein
MITDIENLRAEDLAEVQVLLDEAISLAGTAKGVVQQYDPVTQTLKIIAYRGFGYPFLAHFKEVRAYDGSNCGGALATGQTSIIANVELDKGFAPHLHVAESEKFRSVISLPLKSGATILGVLSCHYHEPRWNWDVKKMQPIVNSLVAILKKATKPIGN